MSTVDLQRELIRQERELFVRRAEATGEAFERITDEMMDLRRRIFAMGTPEEPKLLSESVHEVLTRVRAALDGHIGS